MMRNSDDVGLKYTSADLAKAIADLDSAALDSVDIAGEPWSVTVPLEAWDPSAYRYRVATVSYEAEDGAVTERRVVLDGDTFRMDGDQWSVDFYTPDGKTFIGTLTGENPDSLI